MDRDRIVNMQSATVLEPDGDKIGTVEQIYLDDETGNPEWIAVRTGLFGLRSSLVPLQGARFDGNEIVVAHDKDAVKGAPNVDAEEHLAPDEERQLYEHYGVEYAPWTGQPTGVRLRRHIVVQELDPSTRR